MGTYSLGGKLAGTIMQTGLAPLDDRVGIFLNSNKNYHWQDLKNQRLKYFLFQNEQPSQSLINQYLAHHGCFFGYMHYRSSYNSFFQAVIAYNQTNFPDKSCDFCIPGFCKDGAPILSHEYLVELHNQKIGKISIYWYEGNEKKEMTHLLGDGKEMRIFDPGNLSAKDFKIMTNISGSIVACTGDNSLSQALSYGKIPCYEGRFQSKKSALLNRIAHHFGKNSPLFCYCTCATATKEELEEEEIELFKILESPELALQAKELGRVIREESNFKEVLKGAVNDKLLKQKDNDFAEKEDKIRQDFIHNFITLEELNIRFKELLEEKRVGVFPTH